MLKILTRLFFHTLDGGFTQTACQGHKPFLDFICHAKIFFLCAAANVIGTCLCHDTVKSLYQTLLDLANGDFAQSACNRHQPGLNFIRIAKKLFLCVAIENACGIALPDRYVNNIYKIILKFADSCIAPGRL